MAITERKWVFKKGEVVHLDDFYDIQAFVMKPGFSKPHRSNFVDEDRYDPDFTDEHKILKDFTVTVIIKGGK